MLIRNREIVFITKVREKVARIYSDNAHEENSPLRFHLSPHSTGHGRWRFNVFCSLVAARSSNRRPFRRWVSATQRNCMEIRRNGTRCLP